MSTSTTTKTQQQKLHIVLPKKDMLRTSTSSTASGAGTTPTCLICCDPIEVFAVGACQHPDVCALCCFRRRHLYHQSSCPICKAELSTVLFTLDLPASPAALVDRLSSSSSGMQIEGAVFDDKEVYDRFRSLVSVSCPRCEFFREEGATMDQLCAHLQSVHRAVYCPECLKGRKVFLCEQLLFNSAAGSGELARHNKEWDGGVSQALAKLAEEQERRARESGRGEKKRGEENVDENKVKRKWKPMVSQMTLGHPLCKFCRVAFYGADQLFEHLVKQHTTCPLCEKRAQGPCWQFYRDMRQLTEHYQAAHFGCEVPGCCTGFETLIDLRAHMMAEHPNYLSARQQRAGISIEANFTVLRAGRDGQGIPHSASATVGHSHAHAHGNESRVHPHPRQQPRAESVSPPPVSAPTVVPSDRRSSPSPPPAVTVAATPAAPIAAAAVPREQKPKTPPPSRSPSQEVAAKPPTKDRSPKPTTSPPVGSVADMNIRNARLVNTMRSLVSEQEFLAFRQYSADFRSGRLAPREYHARYFELYGLSDATRTLFKELATLLPDASRRNELLAVHEAFFNDAPTSQDKKDQSHAESKKSKKALKQKAQVAELVKREEAMAREFPVLSSSAPAVEPVGRACSLASQCGGGKASKPQAEDFPCLLTRSPSPRQATQQQSQQQQKHNKAKEVDDDVFEEEEGSLPRGRKAKQSKTLLLHWG